MALFNFLKKKPMRTVRKLKTEEGHKAVICRETIPHVIGSNRYHISIYSLKEPNCIIYGEVVKTSLEDAVDVVKRWKEIVLSIPQPIGLLKS